MPCTLAVKSKKEANLQYSALKGEMKKVPSLTHLTSCNIYIDSDNREFWSNADL